MAQRTPSQQIDRDAPHIRVRDQRGQVIDVIRLNRGSITIGSAAHNAAVLPSDQVAPAQLRLDWDGASSSVLVTDLGSNAQTFVGSLRIQPHASLTWDGGQLLRVGPYTLKLISGSALSNSPAGHDNASHGKQGPTRPRRRTWALAIAAAALVLTAFGVVIYSLLARPAEIVSFALTNRPDDQQPIVQFKVSNAQRVALLVNGQPANMAHFAFETQTGEGDYIPSESDRDFELIAYNALNQPTTSRLTMLVAQTPTPTPTPNPTATPLPNDLFIAEFSFNGLNKANDLSDLVANRGDPLTIAWDVANADSVELQPAGTFKPKDSIRVAPSETTVYTLIARNGIGEAKRAVKVVVIDAQATVAANETALANVKATQDALAAAQAQTAATATASAQGTATAIANLLTQAQAAAQAQATQNAQAVTNATATAGAQATLQALSTAQVSAARQSQISADATATAIAQSIVRSDAARFSQFNGTWVNDDPTAIGVTRFVISNSGPAITVQTFAKCLPEDCNWGTRTQTFTEAPLVARYDFGDGSSRTLTIERIGDKLRVIDADSRGPVRTYTFSPA